MKLTLEPTGKYLIDEARNPKVTIEVEYDNLNMHQVIEDVLKPALLAWGFCESTINKYINKSNE